MSTTDNGGAAFPVLGNSGQSLYNQAPGMTLRDYFAGQALAGILANPGTVARSREELDEISGKVTRASFMTADAMLAARKVQS
jgi:hypothetical protein